MRLHGKNVASFKLAAAGVIEGSAVSYLANLRSIDLDDDFQTQENTALADTFVTKEPVREEWGLSFTLLQSAHPALWALMGATVVFYLRTSGAAGGGTYFTATGVLKTGRQSIGNSPQELTFTLEPRSALSKAAA